MNKTVAVIGAARTGDSPSTTVEDVSTRDIPVPSRSARLGLGRDQVDATVSTTEIPVSGDDVLIPTDPAAVTASQPAPSGRHRLRAPSSTLKARTALVAIAAGAGAFAAGSGVEQTVAEPAPEPAPAASPHVTLAASGTESGSGTDVGATSGVTESSADADMSVFGAQLNQGTKIARQKAAADAAARRPLVVSPIPLGVYDLTSAYAPRWGTFHGGIDMAAPLGTPIHAVTDGVIVKAGPASGFGNWVQLKAPDGTITMYGHMSSSGVKVSEGDKVTAGDVIALVGSEGFSTGPHLHLEKWVQVNGRYMKMDPAVWLAKEGVRLSTLHQ